MSASFTMYLMGSRLSVDSAIRSDWGDRKKIYAQTFMWTKLTPSDRHDSAALRYASPRPVTILCAFQNTSTNVRVFRTYTKRVVAETRADRPKVRFARQGSWLANSNHGYSSHGHRMPQDALLFLSFFRLDHRMRALLVSCSSNLVRPCTH